MSIQILKEEVSYLKAILQQLSCCLKINMNIGIFYIVQQLSRITSDPRQWIRCLSFLRHLLLYLLLLESKEVKNTLILFTKSLYFNQLGEIVILDVLHKVVALFIGLNIQTSVNLGEVSLNECYLNPSYGRLFPWSLLPSSFHATHVLRMLVASSSSVNRYEI